MRGAAAARTVVRKQLVLAFAPIASIASLASGINSIGSAYAYTIGMAILFVDLSALLVYLLCTRSMPRQAIEGAMVPATVGILLADWANAAEGTTRMWQCVILVMDVLLACGAAMWVQLACLSATTVCLLLTALEDGLRLGFYDISGWTEAFPDQESLDAYFCSNPPCARGFFSALNRCLLFFISFFVDYAATRGFAEGQRREQERVLLMVRAAEQVAACLVKFDLPAARLALDAAGAGGLSPELGSSFRSLLANLDSYHPYLPQSCFEEQVEANDAASADPQAPPGSAGSLSGEEPEPPAPGRQCSLHSVPSAASRDDASLASAADSEDAGGRHAAPRAAHAVQHKRVTLLSSNRRGLLAAVEREGRSVLPDWAAATVASFCATVVAQKGVVDHLSADHLQASFGALGSLGTHRVAAVRSAATLAAAARRSSAAPAGSALPGAPTRQSPAVGEECIPELPVTAAVCTGHASCGDFGSASVRRFMVIGGVSAFVAVMERIAAGWGSSVLADDGVYSDAQMHWDLRLRQHVTFRKVADRPIGLWEVCAEKGSGRQNSQTEWMYELGAAPRNPWAVYSTAVRRWCLGDPGGALSLLSPAEGVDPTCQEVARALSALRHAITAGAAPPCCTVPTAAGVGAGSPLGPDP